jgi:hypothetical protein
VIRKAFINNLLPVLTVCLGILPLAGWAEEVQLSTRTVSGSLPVQSWKTLRDKRVVKQDLDYSCGAASIATLLSEYYRRPTTELEVLKLLAKGGNRASFADMQRILPALGFKDIWETRDQPGLEGKMLAILPLEKAKWHADKRFFAPASFPALPLKRLVLQRPVQP